MDQIDDDEENAHIILHDEDDIMRKFGEDDPDNIIDIATQCKFISLAQQKPCKADTTFEFVIENAGRLQKMIVTKPIPVGIYNWCILVTPWKVTDSTGDRGISIGLYLQCYDFGASRRKKDRAERERLVCTFKATIKVISRKSKMSPYTRQLVGRFDCSETEAKYGFHQFMEFSDLMNKNNGYLKANGATVEVDLSIEEVLKSVRNEAGQGDESYQNAQEKEDEDEVDMRSQDSQQSQLSQCEAEVTSSANMSGDYEEDEEYNELTLLKLLVESNCLNTKCLLDCRLICRRWKKLIDPLLHFGEFLSDSTLPILLEKPKGYFTEKNPTCPVNIAVFDLKKPLFEKCIPYARIIRLLAIEQERPTKEDPVEIRSASSDPNAYRKHASVTPANILKLLKLCRNLERLMFNSTEVSCSEDVIARERFTSISLPKLSILRAEISASDFKAYFGGILTMKFPSLSIVELKFIMNCNAISLDDIGFVYTFLCNHKSTLKMVSLISPPVMKTVQRSSKLQRKQKSPTLFISQKDVMACDFDFNNFTIEELKFSLTIPNTCTKVEYKERTLELKFLHAMTKLKKIRLIGFEPTDIAAAIKRNQATLEVIHVQDSPGYLGRNRKLLKYACRELDAKVMGKCTLIRHLIVEDFRLINVNELEHVVPEVLESVVLITYMHPNEFHDEKFFKMLCEDSPYPISPSVDRSVGVNVEIHGEKLHFSLPDLLEPSGLDCQLRVRSARELQLIPTTIEKYFRKHKIPDEDLKIICKFDVVRTAIFCEDCAKKIKCKYCEECGTKTEIGPTTFLSSLPPKAQLAIINQLSQADKKNCRLVCQEWSKTAAKYMAFGFWFNDASANWIQSSRVHLTFLAVSDLMKPLNQIKTRFASQIRVLVLECSKNSFMDEKEDLPIRNMTLVQEVLTGFCDSSALFMPRNIQSIDERNLKWILTHAKNAVNLIFNNNALSNFARCDNLTIIEGNSFDNLYCLTIIVSGIEIYAMESLLQHKFSKLRNFIIRFYFLRRTYTLKQYECLFKFIYRHKKTLQILEVFDPPLPPSTKVGAASTQEHCECGSVSHSTCAGVGTTPSIKKTTTTTSTTTGRNKKTVVKTTTITTTSTSGNSTEAVDKDKDDDCEKSSLDSFKKLASQLNNVCQLTDLKIVFKTNLSSKWLLGLHLLQQQKKLEELYCEGVQMVTVYDMVVKNQSTLKVLQIHSPLTIPDVTLSTDPGSNIFHCETLKKCVNLQSLTIHAFQYFTTGFVKYLPPSPNQIKLLELTIGSDMILDNYFESLSAKLPNLETLILKSQKVLTSKFMLELLHDCQKLLRIFLNKIHEDVLRILQSIHGVYVNQFTGDTWMDITPTPQPDGTYLKFCIHDNLLDKYKKRKPCDGIYYGKKYCPIIPPFPVILIIFGAAVDRQKAKLVFHEELTKSIQYQVKNEKAEVDGSGATAEKSASETSIP